MGHWTICGYIILLIHVLKVDGKRAFINRGLASSGSVILMCWMVYRPRPVFDTSCTHLSIVVLCSFEAVKSAMTTFTSPLDAWTQYRTSDCSFSFAAEPENSISSTTLHQRDVLRSVLSNGIHDPSGFLMPIASNCVALPMGETRLYRIWTRTE
ncbi:hypothetical protein BDV06DRAFT_95188 [Aspergillus oleicola]